MASFVSFVLLATLFIPGRTSHAGSITETGLPEAEIVRRVYDDTFIGPPQFYRDPAVTRRIVLVVIGTPTRDQVARTRDEAFSLVKKNIADSNVPQLKEKPDEERETDRYFDFKVDSYWWRVHKEDYFDWQESTQWPAPSWSSGLPQTVGTLKKKPVTEAAAREFAEYHHVLTSRSAGSKVLGEDIKTTSSGWTVTLYEGILSEPNVSPLPYNTIEVWISQYAFDKTTGQVVKTRKHLASVQGHARRVYKPGTPVPP